MGGDRGRRQLHQVGSNPYTHLQNTKCQVLGARFPANPQVSQSRGGDCGRRQLHLRVRAAHVEAGCRRGPATAP